MQFDVKRPGNANTKYYKKDELDIAYLFTKRLYAEFGIFLRAVVLFGSIARKQQGSNDIDILVVVDDVQIELSAHVVESYRLIAEKIIRETSDKIHLTTLKLTTFWEYIRAGDPVGINLLRDGVPLVDTGFFEPMQALLFQGRVRPSAEAVHVYYHRAPRTLGNSKWHLLQASLDLYWAVIDAGHAALMKLGEIPPSPSHVADMIDERMVKAGIVKPKYAAVMRKFYRLSKEILHKERHEVSGREFDTLYQEADGFVREMRRVIYER
ncbi:nucleotidyltransferase domain-containing protein [Candidatus Woesearchaeota archaeon]|nr:nucleotidyltransferase domain-containing protein [Candidatus Woesearchaeota archaeon]